ncbi:MAG TPA: hypothetical protein PLP33_14530 [Leptospiraceae bacterium]|nr:hypothetical protein [Leptospiraceae bacterium]
MIYNFDLTVDCIESRKNYTFCPESLHIHKVHFSIGLEAEAVKNEEETYFDLIDCVSSSAYIDKEWSLRLIAETIMEELLSQNFRVVKVKVRMAELPASLEITNV